MKSVHFRPLNCSKPFNAKSKLSNNPKKLPVKQEITKNDENIPKPDSKEWLPKRNWNEHLSGEPGPILATSPLKPPPLTLQPIPLPMVHFCSAEREFTTLKCAPSIPDLCDQDKRKIGLLLEELARCKQEKAYDGVIIFSLRSKISKLKTTMKSLAEERQTTLTTLTSIKSNHLKEQSALKEQVAELNKLLAEMQSQKAATEAQTRRIASQAEKMSQAAQALHRDNVRLKGEVASAKDRLEVAQLAVEKMTKDLQHVQERMKPTLVDKACQSTEEILAKRLYEETMETSNKAQRDQELLSELFFNKSVQNNLASRETIIFLPADATLPYTLF